MGTAPRPSSPVTALRDIQLELETTLLLLLLALSSAGLAYQKTLAIASFDWFKAFDDEVSDLILEFFSTGSGL